MKMVGEKLSVHVSMNRTDKLADFTSKNQKERVKGLKMERSCWRLGEVNGYVHIVYWLWNTNVGKITRWNLKKNSWRKYMVSKYLWMLVSPENEGKILALSLWRVKYKLWECYEDLIWGRCSTCKNAFWERGCGDRRFVFSVHGGETHCRCCEKK